MPKNIILCSDGTGNRDIKGRGTNVFKLFEAIDLNEHRTNPRLDAQLAFYDDGVGTRGNTVARIVGGVAGYGLKRNIKELYRELSRVYDEGDRIFLFGFSRGAFTVRTLAGMIADCGVLKGESFNSAGRLRAAVDEAYGVYRRRYDSVLTKAISKLTRRESRDDAITRFTTDFPTTVNVGIKFIGVWDTVDAVGTPFGLSTFVNRVIYQFKFPTQTLGTNVSRACHALSLDDPRKSFEPVLWHDDPRIDQVWFAGVHSNVGGGYPKQGMSLVALDWMLSHAAAHGLRVQRIDRELLRSHASVDDMLYNPRAGVGLFYRWMPRDTLGTLNNTGTAPRIHLTAVERIAHGTDDYAPGNIPPRCVVVITPPDADDPHRDEKLRVLTDRAERVQTVVRQALAGRYLLDTVRDDIALGDVSYWLYMGGWGAFVIAGVYGIGYHPRFSAVDSRAMVLLGVAFAMWIGAWVLASVADSRIGDSFSLFWQQHQRTLRAALKITRGGGDGG